MKAGAWMSMWAFLAACGASGPTTDPALDFLQVGVDPHTEASALEENLRRAGWRIDTRVEGRTFAAMAAAHVERRETAIRVVTRRGIALAMDVPAEQSSQPVALLALDGGDHDRDGDGLEEVVLTRRDPVRERRCLAVVQVLEEGFVAPVPADLQRFGADVCVEDMDDVTGDGRPEALVPVRLEGFARGTVPAITVPLVWRDGRHRFVPGAMADWWRRERVRRERALSEARSARDVEAAYALAVELAALVEAGGGTARERVLEFDDALRGLVLTEGQARAIGAARERIAAGALEPPE